MFKGGVCATWPPAGQRHSPSKGLDKARLPRQKIEEACSDLDSNAIAKVATISPATTKKSALIAVRWTRGKGKG